MILKTLSEALGKQDWFTVTIELVVLVLGVFLGLQVNNWNEARLEDRQSAEYTARLIADLRVEAWNYESNMAYLGEVKINADRALAVLEGSAEATDEQLLVFAYRATQYSDGVRRRATFDELTSTGKIGLVRDPGLRDLAASVYTRTFIERVTAEGANAPYRITFRKLLPLAVQDALVEKCGDLFVPIGDFSAIHGQLDYGCQTGLPSDVIAQAAHLLRTHADILPLLRLQAVNLRTHVTLFTFSNQDILQGLQSISGQTP